MSKKSKILKTLTIFGTALCAPLLLSGCTQAENKTDFRVYNGYIQTTTDGKTWKDLVSLNLLKGAPGDDGDDADVWTIGNDGFWYCNNIKTNNKATGEQGTQGNGIKSITEDTTNSTAQKTVYIIEMEDGSTYPFEVVNGTDADEWTIGNDGYWYRNGAKTEHKAIGKDLTYETYTVTYDYGIATDMFNTAPTSKAIKSTEWLTDLPTVKNEYKNSFLGWFIAETDKQITNYDFIGGDVTLIPKFNLSGLYQNGKYIKTWQDLINDQEIMVGDGLLRDYGLLYDCRNFLNGELIIDDCVTSIGYKAFSDCSNLTSIIIPNSVTEISHRAFSGCSGLTSITIPNSVTSIGEFIFPNCDRLTAIVVEKGNTVYDSRNNCNAIIETATNTLITGCQTTTIPNNIITIKLGAFGECTGLTSIEISSGVTTIESGAFYSCVNLTKIEIPSNVTTIGSEAFYCCDNVTSITVKSGNTVYDSRNNCNAIIETATDTLIIGCQNTAIPNSVTSIGDKAFSGCSRLSSIEIPSSVTTIGIYAFMDCVGLSSIEIPSSVTTIEDYTFYDCSGLTSITIPSSVTSIGYAVFSGCQSLTELILQVKDGYKWQVKVGISWVDCNTLSSDEILEYAKDGKEFQQVAV